MTGVVGQDGLGDPARLDALDRSGLMDSPPEASFDRFTRLAAALIGAPVAAIMLLDDEREFAKSAVGVPPPLSLSDFSAVPLDQTLCTLVVRGRAAIAIDSLADDAELRDHPAARDYGVAAYAGSPLTLSDGKVLGALCVSQRTPRRWTPGDRALLDDLAAAVSTEIELRLVLRAKDEVMEVVSHDLKGPLTAIGLSTAKVQRHLAAAPQAVEATHRIAAAVTSMRALVLQVLDDARGSELPETIRLAPLPIGPVVLAAVAGVRALAEARGVVLVAGDVPAALVVDCDPLRLGQALTNVLHNAVEHTPRGSEVRITCVAAGTAVHVDVRDGGPGVPLAQRQQVFRRGWRARETRRRGHGLGLSIASRYVRAHGGVLEVVGPPDGGATFRTSLPRRQF